jgi:hypothetical protein
MHVYELNSQIVSICFDHVQKYDPDFDAADTVTRALQQELQLSKSSKIPGMYL